MIREVPDPTDDFLLAPKSVMTATATAMLERQSRSMIAHAMHRLLHRLRPYMRAYPIADEPMPEHDVVWVTEYDGGPERVIAEAMESTPALWMQFLPPEVCIVSRRVLEKVLGLSLGLNQDDVIHLLAAEGVNIIMSRAAQKLHELEDAERHGR